MRKWLYGISLLDGWFPLLIGVLAVLAGLFLLLRQRRAWWIYVLAALVAALALAFGIGWALIHVFYAWPEDLPTEVLLWAAVGLAALLLCVGSFFFSARPLRRILGPVAAGVVLLLAALQINAYFGLLTTVGDLAGAGPKYVTGVPSALHRHGSQAGMEKSKPVAQGWKRPGVVRSTGELLRVPIPGTVSGFVARSAFVYVPGVYLLKKRPKLPVLVLISGQPGEPSDWTVSGKLTQAIDAFAAAHHGLAPVVVMPDPNGSVEGNTMCMDTSIAKADTYLSVDVPRWIRSNLDVDGDPRHWAVGGFSFGATCAVQMATRHPDIYPAFLSFSSEREPALTVDRSQTILRAFGGNAAAFNRQVPLTLLAARKYPQVTGFFAAGADDALYSGNASVLASAARAADMRVELRLVAGAGHSWKVVYGAMQQGLDFLAPRLGLD